MRARAMDFGSSSYLHGQRGSTGNPPTKEVANDSHNTTHQPLARVRAVGRRVLHDDHRSDDRQRLTAHDRPRSAFHPDQPAVGGDRLRAHVRWPAAVGWPRRRSAWPPACPDGRARPVHGRVAGLRARDQRGLPDRDPGHPRGRCGDHAARRPVDRDEHVPGGRRAQQGARDLGRARRRRCDRRADRRRASHPLRRMAVHLLPERPDRPGRTGAGTEDRAREPPGHRAPAL